MNRKNVDLFSPTLLAFSKYSLVIWAKGNEDGCRRGTGEDVQVEAAVLAALQIAHILELT